MDNKQTLLLNINRIHTTELGEQRIIKNLDIDTDSAVEYCKEKILDSNCTVSRNGKNFYCGIDNIIITVNAHSYTIITAYVI